MNTAPNIQYVTIADIHVIRATTPVQLDLHVSECCILENNQSINCIGTDFSCQQCGVSLCESLFQNLNVFYRESAVRKSHKLLIACFLGKKCFFSLRWIILQVTQAL